MSWIRRLFGDADKPPRPAPQSERLRDHLRRGGGLQPLELSQLPNGFAAALRQVCESNENVQGVWLAWLVAANGSKELLTTLRLGVPNESTVRSFIAQVDALGGPPCVASLPDGIPSATPFYLRAP